MKKPINYLNVSGSYYNDNRSALGNRSAIAAFRSNKIPTKSKISTSSARNNSKII